MKNYYFTSYRFPHKHGYLPGASGFTTKSKELCNAEGCIIVAEAYNFQNTGLPCTLQQIIQYKQKIVNDFQHYYEETQIPGTAVDLCHQNQQLAKILQKALHLCEEKQRKSGFKLQETG